MIHHLDKHIEKMREKPNHVRKQYALGISFCITGIIFIFWVSSFGIKNTAMADNYIKPKPPLTVLTAGAGDAVTGGFKYIKEIIFGANKTQYASDNVEVTGGGDK
jgi:hypothetical protein